MSVCEYHRKVKCIRETCITYSYLYLQEDMRSTTDIVSHCMRMNKDYVHLPLVIIVRTCKAYTDNVSTVSNSRLSIPTIIAQFVAIFAISTFIGLSLLHLSLIWRRIQVRKITSQFPSSILSKSVLDVNSNKCNFFHISVWRFGIAVQNDDGGDDEPVLRLGRVPASGPCRPPGQYLHIRHVIGDRTQYYYFFQQLFVIKYFGSCDISYIIMVVVFIQQLIQCTF